MKTSITITADKDTIDAIKALCSIPDSDALFEILCDCFDYSAGQAANMINEIRIEDK